MTALVASFRTYLVAASQYRMNLVIWSATSLLQVLVYLAVWQAVARASGGSVGGLDAADFAGYFVVVLCVSVIGGHTQLPWMLPHHIQHGTLSTALVRPSHPLLYYIGAGFAWKVQFLVIAALMSIVVALTTGAHINGSPGDIAAATLIVLLATVQVHLLDAGLSCGAFHLVRIDGVRGMYLVTRGLLGGMFAPLSVLPGSLRPIAEALPFWWAVGYPAQLVSAGRSAVDASPAHAAAVLTAWTIGAWLLLQVTWMRGLRRYGAVGA